MKIGDVALITGAASGLGRQLAKDLAASGTGVAAVDVNGDGLNSLAEELGDIPFASAQADVADAAALGSAVAELENRLGPTDLLIAGAGVGIETSAFALRAEDLRTTIEVNLLGVAQTISAVLPGMISRNRGHIVAISSLASFRGLPRMVGYCATKAGVNALMDGLRAELYGRDIHFTTICPGWVRTPMTEKLNVPRAELANVEEAVKKILWAIGRRRRFYAFPRRLAWRLRLIRWLPLAVADGLIARMLKNV